MSSAIIEIILPFLHKHIKKGSQVDVFVDDMDYATISDNELLLADVEFDEASVLKIVVDGDISQSFPICIDESDADNIVKFIERFMKRK